MKGFDTTEDTTAQAAHIKAAGFEFVGRYLSRSTWKLARPAEVLALKRAGLAVVLVYEDGPTSANYFSSGRGTGDAQRAAAQAAALNAPAGTAIYFTVDYDAGSADIAGPISSYFKEVAEALAGATPAYAVGVYGSGKTCSTIRSAGLAQYCWRAQSTGWAGYPLPGPWDIEQGPATMACTLSVDLDQAATANIGAL